MPQHFTVTLAELIHHAAAHNLNPSTILLRFPDELPVLQAHFQPPDRTGITTLTLSDAPPTRRAKRLTP